MLKKLALSAVLGSIVMIGGVNPAFADPPGEEIRQSFAEATADDNVKYDRSERREFRAHRGFNRFDRDKHRDNERFDRKDKREYRANDRYDRYDRGNRPHYGRHHRANRYNDCPCCDDYRK